MENLLYNDVSLVRVDWDSLKSVPWAELKNDIVRKIKEATMRCRH